MCLSDFLFLVLDLLFCIFQTIYLFHLVVSSFLSLIIKPVCKHT